VEAEIARQVGANRCWYLKTKVIVLSYDMKMSVVWWFFSFYHEARV